VLKAYLEGKDIASAFFLSDLAICRSGAGTVAELAAFRKPSVLVPFKLAFEDHQLHNAREIEALGAADIVQEDELQPSRLEAMVETWLDDAERQAVARQKLSDWDVEDSTDRILDILADCPRKAVQKG
jgi:UDP-N-acetylglucosamine--N-acetylmuramyl-(pentapeptide) pyrophosphoryl-undecaprenol N-acetylglucosamine transferase